MRATVTVDGQALLVEFDFDLGDPWYNRDDIYWVTSVKRDGAEVDYYEPQIIDALIAKKKQLIEEAKKEASIGY